MSHFEPSEATVIRVTETNGHEWIAGPYEPTCADDEADRLEQVSHG